MDKYYWNGKHNHTLTCPAMFKLGYRIECYKSLDSFIRIEITADNGEGMQCLLTGYSLPLLNK